MSQSGVAKPPVWSGGRIAILAGSGRLPLVLAANLENQGAKPVVVLISGEADRKLAAFDHIEIPLEHLAELPARLRKLGVTHVVLGGGISRRPSLLALKPSMALFRLLYNVVKAMSRGDDGLLRSIVELAEREGLNVIGAHHVVPEILARSGILSKKKPGKVDMEDVDAASAALRLVGQLDLGQAAVAIRGRVVAIEGPEGTDAMLRRVADLRAAGKLPPNVGGVLVKCAKPGQELRVDLPSIGPGTIANAKAARLRGIAVEAGKSIILEREKTIADADKAGLFVAGIEAAS